MFKKLLELIRQALEKMVSKNYDTLSDLSIDTVSNIMKDNIELWEDMYCDLSPWLSEDNGIYSLGLAKQICQSLQEQMLSEMETSIVKPGENQTNLTDAEIKEGKGSRADYLNIVYKKHLLPKLPVITEKALALGGVIIKPYINGTSIAYDVCYQGQFYPITFDDDGNITDIAFLSQFTSDDLTFSLVERQTYYSEERKVIVTNKCFKSKTLIDGDQIDLGIEIPLTSIDRWATISPDITIENVDRPLYGYYKVPIANNVDLDSPLGISVFSPAVSLIERADKQFSRLDWEYEGGQIAIDVDPTAVNYTEGYYNRINMDSCNNRLYRKLDLGADDTYKAFTPSLRDASYIQGLNIYTNKIEDMIGLARGTISQVEADARTATEIKLLKQRTYITISSNQDALEECIRDVIYASNTYISLYNLHNDNNTDTTYELNIEWKDSILTDTDAELQQKLELKREGILGKAEIRAWYNGEDIQTAEEEVNKISEQEKSTQLNDIFSQINSPTLEQ